jgi:hypothetical protein
MGTRLAFNRLLHSDWSKNPKKRWTAAAHLRNGVWYIDAPQITPSPDQLLGVLFNDDFKTLAGFDFAIGLPASYLVRIKTDFLGLLLLLGREPWHEFTSVASSSDEISLYRPFYPNRARRGVQRTDLTGRLNLGSFDKLFRDCEKATRSRGAASPVFWTLGGKQVGKGALSGWQEVLKPARKLGAKLWPFDGPLSSFVSSALTLAETYPGEAYQHIGMERTIKKQSQEARKSAGLTMLKWARRHDVRLLPGVEKLIADGFGKLASGEDPFDATAGLFGMIEVVDGRRAEAPDSMTFSKGGEGWILGQTDTPLVQRVV